MRVIAGASVPAPRIGHFMTSREDWGCTNEKSADTLPLLEPGFPSSACPALDATAVRARGRRTPGGCWMLHAFRLGWRSAAFAILAFVATACVSNGGTTGGTGGGQGNQAQGGGIGENGLIRPFSGSPPRA